jgi:hypothetical protein
MPTKEEEECRIPLQRGIMNMLTKLMVVSTYIITSIDKCSQTQLLIFVLLRGVST